MTTAAKEVAAAPAASVSIIIATSARPRAFEQTLHSLATVSVTAGWRVELVVVENVSRNGAEKMVERIRNPRFAAARYLFEPERGKSRALNRAIAEATGDVLLFSDDDVRFPADWIERMCAPIRDSRADAVAGGVVLAPQLQRAWMQRIHRAWLASTADYLSPAAPSEMCGANMAISRRAFAAIGTFDPELGPGITGGGEESLASHQLKAAGFRIAAAFDVVVEHHPEAERLQYKSWLKAAQGKGEATAYLVHHWWHRELPNPAFRRLYVATKLLLRRGLNPRRKPHEEGIAPWELHYVEEIAMYARYLHERRRQPNYPKMHSREHTFAQPATA